MKTICAGKIAEMPPDPEYLEIGRSPIEQREAMKRADEIVDGCETLNDLRREYTQQVREEGPDSLVAEILRMEGQLIKEKLTILNQENQEKG